MRMRFGPYIGNAKPPVSYEESKANFHVNFDKYGNRLIAKIPEQNYSELKKLAPIAWI